jgi:hypothetical protein
MNTSYLCRRRLLLLQYLLLLLLYDIRLTVLSASESKNLAMFKALDALAMRCFSERGACSVGARVKLQSTNTQNLRANEEFVG